MNQLSLIDKDLGVIYRDRGIAQSLTHANDIHDNWTHQALSFLKDYLLTHDRFMCEDLRVQSRGIVPEPPSLRSWGGVIKKAQRMGWIRAVGTNNVSNPNAHRCYATEWERML